MDDSVTPWAFGDPFEPTSNAFRPRVPYPESGGGQFSLHSAGSSELPDSSIVPKCSKISG